MLRSFPIFLVFVLGINYSFAQEICNDGIDNDGDGRIDCYDDDCTFDNSCLGFYYGSPVSNCNIKPPVNPTFGLDTVWASTIQMDTRGTMIIGDVDGDCDPEIVCKDSDKLNALYILDGKTGAVEQTITSPATNGYNDCAAIADVDGDGDGEIFIVSKSVAGPDDRRLIGYHHTSALLWKTTDPIGYNAAHEDWVPQVADFNGDGTPEIYLGNQIYNGLTGAKIAEAPGGATASTGANTSGSTEALPYAADVLPTASCANCAGLELICGNEVYAVNIGGGTMTLEATAPSALPDGFTSIADFNNDGMLDIIVSAAEFDGSGPKPTELGVVYVWDPRTVTQIGAKFEFKNASITNITPRGGRASVSDFDNDGALEIVLAGQHLVVALDNDMSELWAYPTKDGSSITTASAFDFEGDGVTEVVYSDQDSLYIFDGATGNVRSKIMCGSVTRTEYPVIADVNNDGEANIICNCAATPNTFAGNIILFHSTTNDWVETRKVMNQHGFSNSNINDDLSVPNNQQDHGNVPGLNMFLGQAPVMDLNGDPVFIQVSDMTIQIDNMDVPNCNDSTTVTAEVCNIGAKAALMDIPVSIYNGNPLSGGTFIKTIMLPPDTSNIQACNKTYITDTCQSFTFKVASGNYELYLYVNDDGSIPSNAPNVAFAECGLTNNSANGTLSTAGSLNIDLGADTAICNGTGLTLAVDPAYTNVSWSTGASTNSIVVNTSADYWVQVLDGGCNSGDTISVTAGDLLAVSIAQELNTDCGRNGGYSSNLTTTVTSGTGPFTYSWSTTPPQTTKDLVGATPGDYTLTITDGNGCSTTSSLTVEPVIKLDTIELTDPSCVGCSDGTIEVSVTGGQAPYTYRWNDAMEQTTARATGLTDGVYVVLITDSNGCSTQGTIQIGTVGIPGYDQIEQLNIFPNPSNGKFRLAIKSRAEANYILSIIDPLGRLVETKQLSVNSGQNEFQLDLPSNSHGFYFLSLDSKVSSYKLKALILDK